MSLQNTSNIPIRPWSTAWPAPKYIRLSWAQCSLDQIAFIHDIGLSIWNHFACLFLFARPLTSCFGTSGLQGLGLNPKAACVVMASATATPVPPEVPQDAGVFSRLSLMWDNTPEIRQRLRNGGNLLIHYDHKLKKETNFAVEKNMFNVKANLSVLRPVCKLEGQKGRFADIDVLEEQVQKAFALYNINVQPKTIRDQGWAIRHLISTLKSTVRPPKGGERPSPGRCPKDQKSNMKIKYNIELKCSNQILKYHFFVISTDGFVSWWVLASGPIHEGAADGSWRPPQKGQWWVGPGLQNQWMTLGLKTWNLKSITNTTGLWWTMCGLMDPFIVDLCHPCPIQTHSRKMELSRSSRKG